MELGHIGIGRRDIAGLHWPHDLNGLMPDGFLQRLDHVHQANRMAVADVEHTVLAACGWIIERADDPVDNVINIGEIARHFPVAIDFDGLALQDFLREAEIGHVGASPRAIDRKEAQARLREAV